jgi:hypothetical protein
MRDQVGAAHATSWDNLWGGLRSARNALNSSHTGRKPRPPKSIAARLVRYRRPGSDSLRLGQPCIEGDARAKRGEQQ